jgi:hypothetical protein
MALLSGNKNCPSRNIQKYSKNELNSLIITACLETMHGLVFFFLQR